MTVAETTETAVRTRRGVSRAVLFTGVMLGTALAVLAMTDGARLHIGGSSLPRWIQAVLGAVVLWLIIIAVTTVLAELLRRNHKAAARWSWSQARRGGGAAGRRARWHGARAGAAAAGWAGRRWQSRAGDQPYAAPGLAQRFTAWRQRRRLYGRTPDAPRPSRRVDGRPETDADTRFFDLRASGYDGPVDQDGRPVSRDSAPRVCVACGNPGDGRFGPLVSYDGPLEVYQGGRRVPSAGPVLVHEAHFEDPDSGLYGEPYEPAPAPRTAGTAAGSTGTPVKGNTMSEPTATAPRPRRRARNAAARVVGKITAAWARVIASVTDFEPEDDEDLLTWMAHETASMAGYAEAVVEQYEKCLGLGLDPVAMAALHDVADASATAAEAMAEARTRFADHYAQPREFAGNGGLMPHDGRWITGEGDA
jgi:hypothetical protein